MEGGGCPCQAIVMYSMKLEGVQYGFGDRLLALIDFIALSSAFMRTGLKRLRSERRVRVVELCHRQRLHSRSSAHGRSPVALRSL